jgi:hypothetical protein
MKGTVTTCCSLLTPCAFVTLSADEPKPPASADAVKRLVHILELTGRRALAAADPHELGVFVAVVNTGSDLFLVRAQHPAAGQLNQWIHSGLHQRVFFSLRAMATSSGKFLVYDAGADGVQTKARDDGKMDEAREDDDAVVRFSGNLTGQRLTRPDTQQLTEIGARYARLLSTLVLAASSAAAP